MPKTRPNKDAEAFGRRLVELLADNGQPRRGAGAYLHRRYGVAVVTANAWLNGEHKCEPPLAKQIAEAHGSTFEELYWGDDARPVPECDWLPVRGYAQAAGLGHGQRADEWAESHGLMFRKSFYAKIGASPDECAIFYGKGKSMYPTIQDGDAFLFVTTQTTLRKGRLYLLHIDNATDSKEYNVKRYVGGGMFKADNPDDDNDFREPRSLASGDVVLGRVRWIGRMVE